MFGWRLVGRFFDPLADRMGAMTGAYSPEAPAEIDRFLGDVRTTMAGYLAEVTDAGPAPAACLAEVTDAGSAPAAGREGRRGGGAR
jgi:hypothetical protein